MNLAMRVMKDLPWVTSELRTKKKKRKNQGKSFSSTEISQCVTKTQNPKERGKRKLTIFKGLN